MRTATALRKRKTVDVSMMAPGPKKPVLVVDVDWERIPLPEGQVLYAALKSAFERAGGILNARSTRGDGKWICFMSDRKRMDPQGNFTLPSDCQTRGVVHQAPERPRFTDYSRTDSKTGLMVVVHCCSELCAIRYNEMTVAERREKYAPKRGE
jgi:hypothetical protein